MFLYECCMWCVVCICGAHGVSILYVYICGVCGVYVCGLYGVWCGV